MTRRNGGRWLRYQHHRPTRHEFWNRSFYFFWWKNCRWCDPNRAPRANEPRRTVPGRDGPGVGIGPGAAHVPRCAPGWPRRGAWQPQCSGPGCGATKRGLIRGRTELCLRNSHKSVLSGGNPDVLDGALRPLCSARAAAPICRGARLMLSHSLPGVKPFIEALHADKPAEDCAVKTKVTTAWMLTQTSLAQKGIEFRGRYDAVNVAEGTLVFHFTRCLKQPCHRGPVKRRCQTNALHSGCLQLRHVK